jgi:aspartate/methionine/tyrosine aminotransferase
VGEGDLPTPAFISDAADASLRPARRSTPTSAASPTCGWRSPAITAATTAAFDAERFFVTGGGMQAIQIACRMVAGNGDEVLVPTPAWPNITAAVGITGARPVEVPMTLGNAGWTLDLDRLFDAVTPKTRAIFVNSPVQSHRLDGAARTSCGDPRIRAQARPVDRRRRGLSPLLLWPATARRRSTTSPTATKG